EIGIARARREALRFGEPAMRVGRAPLALVDVPEQQRCFAFDVRALESWRGLSALFELLARLFEPAKHHHDVRASEAEPELNLGMRLAEHVERARVIPLRLEESFSPLGTPR